MRKKRSESSAGRRGLEGGLAGAGAAAAGTGSAPPAAAAAAGCTAPRCDAARKLASRELPREEAKPAWPIAHGTCAGGGTQAHTVGRQNHVHGRACNVRLPTFGSPTHPQSQRLSCPIQQAARGAPGGCAEGPAHAGRCYGGAAPPAGGAGRRGPRGLLLPWLPSDSSACEWARAGGRGLAAGRPRCRRRRPGLCKRSAIRKPQPRRALESLRHVAAGRGTQKRESRSSPAPLVRLLLRMDSRRRSVVDPVKREAQRRDSWFVCGASPAQRRRSRWQSARGSRASASARPAPCFNSCTCCAPSNPHG